MQTRARTGTSSGDESPEMVQHQQQHRQQVDTTLPSACATVQVAQPAAAAAVGIESQHDGAAATTHYEYKAIRNQLSLTDTTQHT
jgi:hypothetical protein